MRDENLKVYITKYYKKLFGAPAQNMFSLDQENTSNILQISTIENSILAADFQEEEVLEAITQMEHNKAPGPDGFPAEFYRPFFNVIQKT